MDHHVLKISQSYNKEMNKNEVNLFIEKIKLNKEW